MKIRVSFKELKTTGAYCNRECGAEIEFESNPANINELHTKFHKAFFIIRTEVQKQLELETPPTITDDREFEDLF